MEKKVFVQALGLDDIDLFVIKSRLQDICPDAKVIVVESTFKPESILSELKESILSDLEDSRKLGSIDKYQAADSIVNKINTLLLYSSTTHVKHNKLKKQKLNKNKHGNKH